MQQQLQYQQQQQNNVAAAAAAATAAAEFYEQQMKQQQHKNLELEQQFRAHLEQLKDLKVSEYIKSESKPTLNRLLSCLTLMIYKNCFNIFTKNGVYGDIQCVSYKNLTALNAYNSQGK